MKTGYALLIVILATLAIIIILLAKHPFWQTANQSKSESTSGNIKTRLDEMKDTVNQYNQEEEKAIEKYLNK